MIQVELSEVDRVRHEDYWIIVVGSGWNDWWV